MQLERFILGRSSHGARDWGLVDGLERDLTEL